MQWFQKIAEKFFESKLVIHVTFIILFLALFSLPAVLNSLPPGKILRVIVYSIFLLGCMYAGRWCCRKWLLQNEFYKFALSASISILILFIVGVTGLKLLTSSPFITIVFIVFIFDILFFFLGLFFSVTRTTIRRQLIEADIMQQQKESELQLLRSQISPHFLFNTLNNLYGLSITQHQKIPGLLLKLSDLLRYALYDTTKDFVPLKNEITYIENYIELEKVRIDDRLLIDVKIQKTNLEGIIIAPMLLIVFLENAFKHSKNTFSQSIWLKLDLQIIEKSLVFTIKNSYRDEINEQCKNEASGIGIVNTIKRLELLYPGKYFLEKTKMSDYYQVTLKLKIK